MSPIDKELLKRLPRTFVPALNEQLSRWELLFPAEQRALNRQLEYLARLPAGEFDALFRPIKELEAKMDLPPWEASSQRISIADTSLLVRSPHYSRWRAEVENVFARIDGAIESPHKARRRAIICVLPAGLPRRAAWPRLAALGQTVRLQENFGAGAEDFVRALIGGADPTAEPIERAWLFEAGQALAKKLGAAEGLTSLSFEALTPVRREFLRRLNSIRKDLRSADQMYEELRRLDLAPFLGAGLGGNPQLAAFIRDLFLSGNGSMLFGNSFVEWGAAEAMRRAQPQVLVCWFGIRRQLKPFSSVVLFEDQGRANPVPEQDDPAASLIDAEILAEYVCLISGRLPAYQDKTLCLFAMADAASVLVLGGLRAPIARGESLSHSELAAAIHRWLRS